MINKMSINERLDKIDEKIKEDKFIDGRGLGNEISFYIFDYDARDELKVREKIKSLHRTFRNPVHNRKIIEFDLYKMLLELNREKGHFDQMFEMEKRFGSQKLYKALTEFAQPSIFIEKIANEVGNHNVIFLTGVGKIYPFVRSHTILNNLQERIDKTPVIMFYPGLYDGQSLNLFNKFKDENYYRAFQLVDNR